MTLHISSVFTYDEDAGNYIQAVEAADEADTPGIGALEPATRQAINNFVIGCKQDGIWDAIKASCILSGARTLAGALQPLVGTAPDNYNFADDNYDRKTGLLGDASTKYLDSKRNNSPASGGDPQDNKHAAVFRTVSETRNINACALGLDNTSIGRTQLLTTPTLRFYRLNSGGAASQSDTTAISGLFGASRSSNTVVIGRYAGVSTSYADTSQTPVAGTLLVFARGTIGAIDSPTNARLAFYSIGESLDLALLDARVTDLITAFGAAIP